ncbi:MAG: ATP-binding protein [bacterium]|nr:ATP-binding protein [bacterium]
MNNDDKILEDSIFKIGKVVSVDGRMVRVKVDKAKNTSHLLYKGELLKNISVGGYIKIIKGFTKIVGKVEGEFINEDKEFLNKGYGSQKEKINRILNISLLGFFKGNCFERGIKELPLIDNECFLLHNTEFNQVHDFLRDDDKPITIGTLSLEKGQEIRIGINSLFASHIGIFGNTGSGKSYTLAKIYRELFLKYKDNENFKKNAEFFLIDFNGEYVDEKDNVIIEKEYKNIYKLSTRTAEGGDKFPVLKENLNDSSFWAVLLEATEKTQTPFLRRALSRHMVSSNGDDLNQEFREEIILMISEAIKKKDKNLGAKIFIELFSDLYVSATNQAKVGEIKSLLKERLGFNGTTGSYYVSNISSDQYSEVNIETQILTPLNAKIRELEFDNSEVAIVRLKIVMKYYDEIIKGYSNRDHLSPLIKRLENRIEDLKKIVIVVADQAEGKNFTIVSLKDVNFDIRKVLPLLLCKKLYDEKKVKKDNKAYLNIIVDEAHNILSWNSERESEQWKDYRLETFEEIIKEGRKFGVFLTIASQRPADISATIISQLHNFFLHRLINNNDILAVEKTISYLDKVSFDYLPILPTGTCILAGILAQVPVVVDIGKIEDEYEPRNKTMTLVEKWEDPKL